MANKKVKGTEYHVPFSTFASKPEWHCFSSIREAKKQAKTNPATLQYILEMTPTYQPGIMQYQRHINWLPDLKIWLSSYSEEGVHGGYASNL